MSRSSTTPEFDQRIADWLEDDPDDAPDAVLATVLAAFPSIPQRRASRVPWRNAPMTQTSRLLAGVAAIVVVFVGGVLLLRPGPDSGVGGASPSALLASPRVSALARLDRTFTSNRYGYSVAYPNDWTAAIATLPWTADTANSAGSGINDELRGTGIRFSGASQILASGQTADAWIREFGSPVGALAGQGGAPETWPTVTIGGAPGWIDVVGGADPTGKVAGTLFDAVVVAGRYGYNFSMVGNVDHATFEAFLATVKLASIPTLDQTFASPLGGYTIQRPSAWTVTPATKSWTSGYETETYSDHIGTAPRIDGTSTKLPAGMTFDAWFAAYDADRVLGTACGAPSRNEDITIDGAVGHLDIHCSATYLEAVVPKGGRVYVFTMFAPFSLDAPYSRPLFETLLATVHLTPTTARN
jgi:hypothetical protein